MKSALIRSLCGTFLLLGLLFPVFSENQRIVHFSIDDAIIVFQNLTKNEEKYNSAFDEPLLNRLKKLHDKYGLKITMYVFYDYGGFCIADCTEKFAPDFMRNSQWLKFAYHAYNGTVVFDNTGGGTIKQ